MSTFPHMPGSSGPSVMDQFMSQSPEERRRRLATMTDDEFESLPYQWELWARPNQMLPPDDFFGDYTWVYWLVKAGRGYGKTRVGSETVRIWVKDAPIVNLIGATADDARDIMIEGPAGILAICPKDERPKYEPSNRRLRWPNGAVSLIFTADEPDRLRGKQHAKLWGDEIAAWRYAEAWDQAKFGLRIGDKPQAILTSTPRPTKLIKDLINERDLQGRPITVVTHGTTRENEHNLAPAFLSAVVGKYKGTRLGRQELDGEILDDNPGALFHLHNIDADRVDPDTFWREVYPELLRIVIPIDPAASSDADSDETGIIPVGKDKRNPAHYYVLDDVSGIMTPDGWANAAVHCYKKYKADRVVGEVNNGGEMVEACVRHVDPDVSYKEVHATRGKEVRAEPVAALYEQHRVHHVGSFKDLEDQMTNWNPADSTITNSAGRKVKVSPDRMDSLVWGITELSEGNDTLGLVDYMSSGKAQSELNRLDKLARDMASGIVPSQVTAPVTQAQLAHQSVLDKVQGAATVAKPATNDSTPTCQACGSTLVQTVAGGQKRCGQCGIQWGLVPTTQPQTRSRAFIK